MDQLLSFLKEFDIANALPETAVFTTQLRWTMAILMLIGPLLLIGLGAWYYFLPRTRINDPLGFQGLQRIEDKKTWLFAQRLAGLGYGILGIALFVVFGVLCLFFIAMTTDVIAVCTFVCVMIELLLTLAVWIGIQILTAKNSN